jgi:hypothetical protein
VEAAIGMDQTSLLHGYFCQPPPSGWVNLSDLTLWSFDFRERQDLSRLCDALENMNSLCRITIHDHYAYEYPRRYGPIGLRELQFELDGAFTHHHTNLISFYPNLTSLTLIIPLDTDLGLPDAVHLNLHSLSILVLDTYDLAPLNYLITPALSHLEIRNRSKMNIDPHDGVLSQFIDQCTSKLTSIALIGSTYETFILWALPQLSNQRSITHLILNMWPSAFTAIAWKRDGEESWFPNLRRLTISLEAEKRIELGRMEALSAWLKQRQALGEKGLECLTLHKCSQNLNFPYALFEHVMSGRLCVMVPLGSK